MDSENLVLNALIDEIILEHSFEMHYAVRVGDMTLDDLYGLRPIKPVSDSRSDGEKESKKASSSSQALLAVCPVCKESVAGQRFAPHLEKCLSGGKRGGLNKASGSGRSNAQSSNSYSMGLPYYTAPKKPIDHYPQSLVVRVKLKDGVPKKNQIREGAPLSEFLAWKQKEKEREKGKNGKEMSSQKVISIDDDENESENIDNTDDNDNEDDGEVVIVGGGNSGRGVKRKAT